MEQAAVMGQNILVSAISLAEIVYLVEKGRLEASAYDELKRALADPGYVIEEAPLIVEAMRRIPRDAVPDIPDRIIAATAVSLGIPVISRDGQIRASYLQIT